MVRHIRDLSDSSITDSLVDQMLKWVRDIPEAARTPALLEALRSKTKLTEEDMAKRLSKKPVKSDFDELVPSKGWLHDYIEYTRNTEPPTVFHFFAGMVTIGAALARNVLFDMGSYQVYPNLCVIIVAPSGKCRKTSACNLGIALYRATGGNVLADKITPEALISAFKDRSSATGLIYAPELAVFLGKQKYQEGMVPLLTALFDCPKEWNSQTIMRGEASLHNVALSLLACSTMDWIQTAIPRDAFGGGFMSRLLFVVQNDTPRSFPIPPALPLQLEQSLKAKLFSFSKIKGKFEIGPGVEEWYTQWYNKRHEGASAEKQYAGYLERKPDQLKRIAMILTIAELPVDQHVGLVMTVEKLEQALKIINWVEAWLPDTFDQMSQSAVGEEHARLLKQLKGRGGMLDHSSFLRLNSNRMNSKQFRDAIDTLRSAKLIDFDGTNRTYYLTPDGWSK